MLRKISKLLIQKMLKIYSKNQNTILQDNSHNNINFSFSRNNLLYLELKLNKFLIIKFYSNLLKYISAKGINKIGKISLKTLQITKYIFIYLISTC
jgi:hypothetical protein